jgi:tRNA-dihydrouridine synthase B
LAATPLFKGIPDFKSTRIAMLRANTLEELFSIMDEIPVKYEDYIQSSFVKSEELMV